MQQSTASKNSVSQPKNYPKEYLEGRLYWLGDNTEECPDNYSDEQKEDWWNGFWGDGEDKYES